MTLTKFIKQYTVNVAGQQNGTDIPSGFRVMVTKGMVERKSDDSGYNLFLEVCTFEDNNHQPLLTNDAFPRNNHVMDLGASLPTSAIKTLVNNNFDAVMDTKYGSGNWSETT